MLDKILTSKFNKSEARLALEAILKTACRRSEMEDSYSLNVVSKMQPARSRLRTGPGMRETVCYGTAFLSRGTDCGTEHRVGEVPQSTGLFNPARLSEC